MKLKLFFWICVAVSLSSCQLASFSARPGAVIKDYPKDMYGTYRAIEKHDGVKDTHDVVISEKGAKMQDGVMSKFIDLSDTNNTLSRLGDFYYLNVREKDSAGHAYWYVYPFEFDGKNLYVYTL